VADTFHTVAADRPCAASGPRRRRVGVVKHPVAVAATAADYRVQHAICAVPLDLLDCGSRKRG
jgi:hypothetical protein